MNAGDRKEGIYVELDVLLDTRLGTLAKLDPKLADTALDGNYHSRRDDNFPGVDIQAYKDAYANRDVETLALSTVTNAVLLIKNLASTLNEQAVARPYHDGVRITVNVYPYQLSGEECEAIQKAILIWLGNSSPVDLISVAPIDLTPSYCKGQYSMMIMYEYEQWMEMQTKAFEKTRIPEITLFVPAIYFNKTPTDQELESATRDGAHPQMAIEMLASPLVELRLIDVKYFSIIEKT